MSVLIKGMKMPTACFWREKNDSLIICPLCDADGYCGADGKQRCLVPENEMPNDCPLIEIPPHGRLIDADELHDKIIEYCSDGYAESADDVCEILDYVRDAPTILEAEV